MDNLETKYKLIIQFLSEVNFKLTEDGNLFFKCDSSTLQTIIGEEADIYDDYTEDDDGFKLTNPDNKILDFTFYPSIKKFYSNLRRFINSKKPTIVYNEKSKVFNGYIEGINYTNQKINTGKNFFSDIVNYSEFENLWIKEAEKADSENNLFRLIDHYNTSKDSFLLVSSGSRAVIKMPFKFKIEKSANEVVSTEKNLKDFKSLIENEKDKTIHFLKNEIIKRSKYNGNNLLKIFWSFEEIYRSAYKSYMIFIEDISLEKLQTEYEEFKSEYLKTYSDLISKILFKIISAPITFGAITFALSKIQSNLLILVLLVGLFATSILIYQSLKSHLLDLKSITQQLEIKTNQIKNLEFFKENDDEINELENYLILLKGKIKLAITFLISSFLLTFLFTTIITFYPLFKKLELFWKEYSLKVFNAYDWMNISISLLFIFFSLIVICNNSKKMLKLISNASSLTFNAKII